MQKKRKIIISIAISLGLALAATQISNNGGLQSSILAPLQTCKTSAITSLERCKTPLTTEKARIQKVIDSLTKKITAKKTECAKLSKIPSKSKQLKTCRSQLSGLEKEKKTQETAMKAIDIALAKLVSELPLQQELTKLQTEIATLTTQITNKTTECTILKNQKKITEASTCQAQLDTIKNTKITKEAALAVATEKLKKIAGASAVAVTTVVIQPIFTPTPINPVINPNPSPLDCCFDMDASNYDPTCIAPRNPNPESCEYTNIPVIVPVFGCTNPGAKNYNISAVIDDGSCDFSPEIREGCTNTDAHNYESGANQDNGMCQTCSDGVKNGDEEDVDCGGNKCSECAVGCKDPNATNYNPEAKKEGPCIYPDTTTTPNYYCDVPEAVNYETHEKEDTTYEADAKVCNFCGNGTKDGDIDSEGNPLLKTFTGDGGTTVDVAEQCDEGKDDKPYDGCYMCRIESCGDEILLCRAYEFTGGESGDAVSSKLRKGLKDNTASKRPEWNNHGVDAVTSWGRDFATFGATCVRNKDKGVTSYTGYRTVFGLTVGGSVDNQDNGLGSPDFGNVCRNCSIRNAPGLVTGYSGNTPTANKVIRGVAVPQEMLREIFSTDVNYRRVRVDVTGPNGCYRYPIVDEGPSEYTWARKCSAILDMTYAAAAELGLLTDPAKPVEIKWTIRENVGEDFRERLTPDEVKAGFKSMTFGNTYGYKYRQNTQIDYPQEYIQPTRC